MISPPNPATQTGSVRNPRGPIVKSKGDLYIWHQWSFGLMLSVGWGIVYSFLAKGPGEVAFWWTAVVVAALAFWQIFRHNARLPQGAEVAITVSVALIVGVAGYKIFYAG